MPSFAPAGILTLTCLFLRTLPLPPQTAHGFSMILPSPPHLEHGVESAKNPWSLLCTPLPPHSGHVSGAVPGAAPVPLHSPHASSTGTPIPVVPEAAEQIRDVPEVRAAWLSCALGAEESAGAFVVFPSLLGVREDLIGLLYLLETLLGRSIARVGVRMILTC